MQACYLSRWRTGGVFDARGMQSWAGLLSLPSLTEAAQLRSPAFWRISDAFATNTGIVRLSVGSPGCAWCPPDVRLPRHDQSQT
jgi:hypothetical protein